MTAKERQQEIIHMLGSGGGFVKMTEIVDRFSVSNETARRDLEALQDKGLVRRIYGGAVLLDSNHLRAQNTIAETIVRAHGQQEREAIGRLAATLIREGDTILMSSGTTVQQVAKNIKKLHTLTILTNSLAVINELSDTNFDIYVLGGKLDNNELNMSGDITMKSLSGIFVDKAILGAGGVTLEYGVSDYGINDITVREEMVRHAGRTILVAQSSKFGKNALSIGLPLDKIHTVVTDSGLAQEYRTAFSDMGLNLLLADI